MVGLSVSLLLFSTIDTPAWRRLLVRSYRTHSRTDFPIAMNKRFLLITGFILFAVFSRVLPHPYNFTPLGAIALFGAAYFRDMKWAILIPVSAMWVGDLILNNGLHAVWFDGATLFAPYMIWIYGSMILISLFGRTMLRRVTSRRVAGSAVIASVLFFLITNFGVWAEGIMYPLSLEGLIACYAAGLPFFHNTLAGNIVYSALLFGAFEFVANHSQWLEGIAAEQQAD